MHVHEKKGSVIGIKLSDYLFPHIIFRMDQLPLYDIKHSKHVTVYLQQRKQLYTPETRLLSITNNKTLGHMTPFMALLPLLDKKIVQTYPDMGAGGNGGLFYVPSSATVEQNPSYVQSGRLDWSSYSTQGQHLLIKRNNRRVLRLHTMAWRPLLK